MINYFEKLEEYDLVIDESINKVYCIDNISNNTYVEDDMLIDDGKFSIYEKLFNIFGVYPIVLYYEINQYNLYEEKNLMISSRSAFCKKMKKI